MKHSRLVREIVEVIALALIIFLAIHFSIQNYTVNDHNMEPGLHSGQFVLVNRLVYLFHSPERGDVIVFQEPDNPGTDLIKRIIGLPGDTVKWDGTNVWVDGAKLNEPYITKASNYNANTVMPGPNQYFVMGDNRPNSKDSRSFGVVPKDYIVGKAVLVDWPLGQWQFISTYPSVYANVK